MYPFYPSLMDLIPYAIDAYTMQLAIKPLTDHVFIFDDLLVLPLILVLQLGLLLVQAPMLATPVVQTKSREELI